MAFDFGAALSSIGQIAPAMSEGAEIRRQRQADAADVAQRAQAAQDTHSQREAQTAREQQLTAQEQQNSKRFTPISSKPERGEDGRYYMLFLSPDNKIQRLPVEGNYDPNAENKALLKELSIPEDSEIGRQVLLKLKPETFGTTVDLDPQSPTYGKLVYYSKTPRANDTGAPTPSPGAVSGPSGAAIGGRMPAALTPSTTTRTGQHFYIDNDNNLREVPYTTTATRTPGRVPTSPNVPRGTQPVRTPSAAPSGLPPSQAGGGAGKIIGPSKLSTAERATLQTDQQITGFANEVLPQIERAGLQNANGVQDSVRALAAWGEYKAGRVPSDPFYASIIRPVAAISIAGAAPWVRIGRNRYTFDVIQQHLPHPWQTPARIYDNVKWLRDNVVPSSEKSILGPVSQQSKPQPNDPLGIR